MKRMQTAILLGLILAAIAGGAGCAASGALPGAAPLTAVDTLDSSRYLGR